MAQLADQLVDALEAFAQNRQKKTKILWVRPLLPEALSPLVSVHMPQIPSSARLTDRSLRPS